MKETRDIITAFTNARAQGIKAALATVVHVEGSSYRRPGARMLVTEDGRLTGAISGGCLEGDALRKALLAIQQEQNKLVTYDTTGEDDASFGVQLGCNGIVHILFEPIDIHDPFHPIRLLEQLVSVRQDAVLVTLFSLKQSTQPGTCMLQQGDVINSNLTASLNEEMLSYAKSALQERASTIKHLETEQQLTALIEFIPPAVSVIIAGAGNDAIPLAELTAILGWHTTVVDGRPTHANAQRFPNADRILVARPAELFSELNTDAQTAFVLLTHNYNYDLEMLKQLQSKDFAYIGILGPKKKMDRMLAELGDQGIIFSEDQRAKIHSPVGLDIGAETAEEIALSVVAEIKAVLSRKCATFLKDKAGSIHPAIAINHE